MKQKLIKCIAPILLAILLVATVVSPVLAIADPDDMQVLAVYVYEDCLEEGDVGVLVYYLIDYGFLPSETATEAYLFIFMDTDGVTQLKAVAPYTFVDSGYGYGMAWIYFTAAEATTHGLDSADAALYSIRLSGNPTVVSGWTGDPPSVSVGIDYWQTTGTTGVLVGIRVLYYADVLELLWVFDLVQTTAEGNKLTALGEEYFVNVILGLRTIAPSIFVYSSYDPLYPDVDYSREFGAVVTSGTGNVTGSPVTLTEGTNIVTANSTGTIIATLTRGTVGTATNGTGNITGSPVSLVAGTNTLTVTVAGNITFNVALNTTQTMITDTIIGTGWDLTDLANLVGMSRMWLSMVVWSVVTLLVCAAVYKKSSERNTQSAGKVTFLMFNCMFLGGAVIGMVSLLAPVLIFLGCDAFIGYLIFFKPANV